MFSCLVLAQNKNENTNHSSIIMLTCDCPCDVYTPLLYCKIGVYRGYFCSKTKIMPRGGSNVYSQYMF